mmetsp:Transcript_17584/g.38884  ORF Transcript_17584/g.38884 Transcript_17584/m.38884 type:complete len:982 (+) Transcript_17584:123-3068(+)
MSDAWDKRSSGGGSGGGGGDRIPRKGGSDDRFAHGGSYHHGNHGSSRYDDDRRAGSTSGGYGGYDDREGGGREGGGWGGNGGSTGRSSSWSNARNDGYGGSYGGPSRPHSSSSSSWGGDRRKDSRAYHRQDHYDYRQQERWSSRNDGPSGTGREFKRPKTEATSTAVVSSTNGGRRVVSSTSTSYAASSSARVSDSRTGAIADGDAAQPAQERIKPLEELVTKDTWNECSWDERIASQHPDFGDYLRPGQKIETILTTCPFGSLRDGSKGDVWFAKKVRAADAAFEKALSDAEPDEIDNLPVSREDVKKFFDALPYNVTFLIGFDVLGVNAKDERHCLCPCSSKCAKWRRQFGIERILEDFGNKEACVNTFKSSGPYALMQHLNQKAGQRIGLHYFVLCYVRELYGPPYCGRVGHKGLYPPSSAEYKKAEAYERKKDIQARNKLEKELEEERKAKRVLEEEAEKLQERFRNLEMVSKDQAERLKAEEENARRLGIDTEELKKLKIDLDQEKISFHHENYRAFFDSLRWAIESGSKGTGGTVDFPDVPQNFKVEELFENYFEKKHFLFKPTDHKNENVGGKILRDWNIKFDTSGVSKLKKVKKEIQAIDKGGPSREFMHLVWQRFTELKITAEGNDGEEKVLKLLYRESTGYAFFQKDEAIVDFLEKLPACNREKVKKKICAYYQAIGRMYLHAFAIDMKIPTTAFPPFFRNVLLRNLSPGDEAYPNPEVFRDVKLMGFDMNVNDIIGRSCNVFFCDGDEELITEETFYTVFLEKLFIKSRRKYALKNVRLGLTLDNKIGVHGVFRAMPTKALEQIAFATEGLELDHVLQFLLPKYCKAVRVWKENKKGELKPVDEPVEPWLLEQQKSFFEVTLPNVLKKQYYDERGDEEAYSKKIRRWEDFLSRFVQYCTGSPFLCHPDIKTRDDMIKIEFSASEMSGDCLPEAHTCVKTLKLPHFVYDNNADALLSKLRKAFDHGGFGQA